MVHGASSSAIATLSDASASVARQLDAARKVKNLIIGQNLGKEFVVQNGLIKPLANVLLSTTRATSKRRLDPNTTTHATQTQEWEPEDDVRLQTTLLFASLAAGGPAFTRPLCAANVPEILVQALATDSSPRLITATLQALKALATSCSALHQTRLSSHFWKSLFNEASSGSFDSILLHAGSGQYARRQIKLVAEIISLLPDNGVDANECKSMLTNNGILDTLASLLVSHAVEQKTVWSCLDSVRLPLPPSQDCIPSILAAISSIITGSNYRAHKFILSPAIRALFAQASVDTSESRAVYGPRYGFAGPHEPLLPPLYIPSYATISHHQPSSSNFSALGSIQFGKQGQRSLDTTQLTGDIDHSNAVCSWLLLFARSAQGQDRLRALRLLALVFKAVTTDAAGSSHRTEYLQKTRERERQLALLAVPLAVNLVQFANESRMTDTVIEQYDAPYIRENACDVLALLIGGTADLQIAAVDAGTIKHVCSLLKKSFDNVALSKPMWSTRRSSYDPNAPDTSRLGSHGLPLEILHAMRCRQSALEGLAALAAKEDIHRKAIIESGVVSSIIDSLKPYPSSASSEIYQGKTIPSPKDGNVIPVIIAACHAAQSISRSVSVLRTSLFDGGIAKPLIELLTHASVDVQIAATDVCCNLLPDFSPMREDLSINSVVKIFAEHARNGSPALRLSSLWALKHLVYSCSKDMKISTLDELGTGWLVEAIQGEQHDTATFSASGGVSIGLSSANAAGEQVDLLNPSSMDIDEPGAAGDVGFSDEDEDGEILFDEATSTHYQSSQLRSTLNPAPSTFNSKKYLSSIRDMEQNDEYTSRRDEASIQKQALDFIRNLLNGDDNAAMSDHLMNQIGSAKVYELLTAKLSPLPRSVSGGRPVFSPTELVLSTIHIISHLANSARHRPMVITQKPLLQAMLPHFNHHDHNVRLMSVYVVINLTWIGEDRRDAHLRAKELKALGMERAVRALQNDPDQNVRERVKTAIQQFETL